MTIGARDLLNEYHGSRRNAAEAYVKGEITGWKRYFIWEIITQDDVDAAKKRVKRCCWSVEDRLTELEKEVAELKQREKDLREEKYDH